jgi:hypothetical protein
MHFQFCIESVKYMPHLDVIISDKFKIDRRATGFVCCVLMTSRGPYAFCTGTKMDGLEGEFNLLGNKAHI